MTASRPTRSGSSTPSSRWRSLAGFARRMPVTLTMVAILLTVGVISRGLWEPFVHSSGMELWAYGLPAFSEGRWWTAVTGTFLVPRPHAYIPTLIVMAAMGALEYARGSRVAAAYFWVGQLFAVFATALVLAGLQLFPDWAWAHVTAASLGLGPSAGAFACLAAFLGIAPSPWRARGWLVLLLVGIVGVFVLGRVTDLERLLAVLLILAVDRSLRPQRTTVREQRMIAFLGMLIFVAVEVLLSIAPTNGPFGSTEPLEGSALSVLFDVVVVLLIANGLRRAHRWAWIVALLLLTVNILFAVLLILLLPLRSELQLDDLITNGTVALDIGSGFLSLVMIVYLILVRGAFARHRHAVLGAAEALPPTRDEIVALLHERGGGTLSWMTTWGGNDYMRTPDGAIAFQKHTGTAIALGDPLGTAGPEATKRSVDAFIEASELAGLAPCFFSASAATRVAVPSDWRALVVADDTIVDLPELAFTGKRWNSVRTSLNKAEREEITFRLTRLRDLPWGIRAQLRRISEEWVGDKELPEMRFTLGTLTEAEDPEVRIALAIDPHGSVDGFLSWLPIYGENGVRGWTLDLMRRREGGFGPVMEYLIASSALAFRDEGAKIMSLSGAPLAHEYPPEAGAMAVLSARLSDSLEPVYGFQSLHRFKAKFQPRYETLFLLYRDEADLARIGAALTRAFLPDATARQFARAGFDLVRGSD